MKKTRQIISIAFSSFIILMVVAIIYHSYKPSFFHNKNILCDNNGYSKIPKILHQTYPGKFDDPLPRKIEDNIEYIQMMNPSWEYRLYRDDDIERFIKDNYDAETLEIYKKINPEYGPARADFFRYLLMYKVGGVYLDIKSATTKPLDQIISKDDTYIIGHWKHKTKKEYLNYSNGECQQWHIITVPKHPFIEETIKNVKFNILNYNQEFDGIGKFGVLKTTGPIVYSESIIPLLKFYPHRTLLDSEKAGLKYDNIGDHKKLFKKHYSELTTPIII